MDWRGRRHRLCVGAFVATLLLCAAGSPAAGASAQAPVDPPVPSVTSRDAPAEGGLRWILVSARSQAQFRVRLFGLLPLSGDFTTLSGAIAFDPSRETAVVDAILRSDALRMGNASHAAWARSAEFFDAATHPEILYQSAPIPRAVLRDGGRVDGQLTLRGITREVGLRIEGGSCDPAAHSECEVEVFGQVRRSDFGMASRRATVSDWVSLRLRIVASAAGDAPPPAPARKR
jgi:polyisoprenoid-binding protein YceI